MSIRRNFYLILRHRHPQPVGMPEQPGETLHVPQPERAADGKSGRVVADDGESTLIITIELGGRVREAGVVEDHHTLAPSQSLSDAVEVLFGNLDGSAVSRGDLAPG